VFGRWYTPGGICTHPGDLFCPATLTGDIREAVAAAPMPQPAGEPVRLPAPAGQQALNLVLVASEHLDIEVAVRSEWRGR
jgi:hypothetical protein